MSCEIELKYSMPDSLSPADVLKELGISSGVKEIFMKSTYFDTPENLLGKFRASIRHRMENNDSVYTVKTSHNKNGALAERGEWQVFADSLDSALPLLEQQGVPPHILAIAADARVVIAEFEFTRLCVKIEKSAFSAELCIDIGYLSPDGVKKAPLREIELELISGDVPALCEFGEELAKTFNLAPQSLSKLSRARNLK